MNFDFSEEQEAFRNQIRRLVVETSPTAMARAVHNGEVPYAEKLWQGLAEMGALGIGIPEEKGGVGLGPLELCIVAEEIGRTAAPVPWISSRALAAEALVASETDAHLTELASGETIACYASSLTAIGNLQLSGAKLNGTVGPVLDAPLASLLVLASELNGTPSIITVTLDQPGVKRDHAATIDDSHSHADLIFDDAVCDIVATGEAAAKAREAAEQLGALLAAFEQLGGADACLTAARDYALFRSTFGRVIGSYQAIKHKLADVHVRNTIARGHAYHGAWALNSGSADAQLAVAGARAAATEAFTFASQESLQTHGGIGFTWEQDCHLFYRRARLLALALGPVPLWKERIVRQLEMRAA